MSRSTSRASEDVASGAKASARLAALACAGATILFSTACERGARSTSASAPSSAVAAPTARVELAVYAATSTRDVLLALEAPFEREHPVDLVFNFGSSGDLARQIVAAAKADVFLSADEREMDRVDEARLVARGTRRSLLSNQLVVVEPGSGPSLFAAPFQPADLAQPAVRWLSVANVETVPAGRYAKHWLETVGVWAAVQDRVLPGVDVRAALSAVESGGAQAGIVYRTDAATSKRVRRVHVVPLDQGPRISYPVAVIAGRPRETIARAFADFLGSDGARASFEAAGFLVLDAPAPK